MSVTVEDVLADYDTITARCSKCAATRQFKLPVALRSTTCAQCASPLDFVSSRGPALVNHQLMRRLILTCYRHPHFASRVIELYKRDYDRGLPEEWGIDKRLLAIHALNARLQRGHSRWWLAILALTLLMLPAPTLLGPILTAVLLVIAAQQFGRNDDYAAIYLGDERYDPTHINARNMHRINKLLRYLHTINPEDLLFFRGFDPFSRTGNADTSWSILVDRRKRADGSFTEQPADLDLSAVYKEMIESAQAIRSAGTRGSRFYLDEVVFVDGSAVETTDNNFVDDDYYPRAALPVGARESFATDNDDRYRLFKRIRFYNPLRDFGMSTFLRLTHHGPFTYIECVGTRLLPLVEKLFGTYTWRPTSEELNKRFSGLRLWTDLSMRTRRQILFVLGGLLTAVTWSITINAWDEASRYDYSRPSVITPGFLVPVGHIAIAGIMLLSSYASAPKLKDAYEPTRELPFPLGWLLGQSRREKERQRHRRRIKHTKEAGEFNYGPDRWSLRQGQSRIEAENFFESSDLSLIRRSQDWAIQQAFLACLEDAGIDTSDFREGATQINNYGIINQGYIGGSARSEVSRSDAEERNKAGSKRRLRKRTGKQGSSK